MRAEQGSIGGYPGPGRGWRAGASQRIHVGPPDVEREAPSHVPGVRQGNQRTLMVRNPGIVPQGPMNARATPRRSTGINPDARRPIDPRSPVLSPA